MKFFSLWLQLMLIGVLFFSLSSAIPLRKTSELENGFRSCRVSNLIPDALYAFRIRAVNMYGVGAASLPSGKLSLSNLFSHPNNHCWSWDNILLVCIYPTPPHGKDTPRGHFWVEFNWFEFRVFYFLGRLSQQSKRIQFALLLTHRWKENNWIHTLHKEISTI